MTPGAPPPDLCPESQGSSESGGSGIWTTGAPFPSPFRLVFPVGASFAGGDTQRRVRAGFSPSDSFGRRRGASREHACCPACPPGPLHGICASEPRAAHAERPAGVPRISPAAVMGPVHPDTRSAHPLHPVGCSSIRFVSRPGTGRITNIPGRGTGWGVGGGTSDPEAGSPRGLPQPALPRHTKSNVLAAACAVEERQAKCSVGVSGFAP